VSSDWPKNYYNFGVERKLHITNFTLAPKGSVNYFYVKTDETIIFGNN
jgi:hypothetical protein